MLATAKNWLTDISKVKSEWQEKRRQLMKEKTDLTLYLVNYVQNFK
jgi:hypothetical protein